MFNAYLFETHPQYEIPSFYILSFSFFSFLKMCISWYIMQIMILQTKIHDDDLICSRGFFFVLRFDLEYARYICLKPDMQYTKAGIIIATKQAM